MLLISYLLRAIHISLEFLNVAIVYIRYNEWTIVKHFRKQGAIIGQNCYFQTRYLSDYPYLITIGNHVFISHNVSFHTHIGSAWILTEEIPGIDVYGTITIEDNCIIGRNAQILSDVRIGKNSIVGANSVVITDVPPDSIVMGVPARVVGSIHKYREKCIAKWEKQKPPDYQIVSNFDWRLSKQHKENQKKFKAHLVNLLMNQETDRKQP
jgi:acetyltransferase-like isoleucine patch superfamily enzyme